MENSQRIYGIDLGTTYSCIAYADESGKPVVVANSEGQLTTPSVVFFESPNNIVVGKNAKDLATLHPNRVVSAVKRAMGNPHWLFEYDSKTYTPQEISSFILKKLVQDAQIITGDTISDVVITCPAYFGVIEREATKQAGILAGLNVRYVIPEPTAAAIAYGIEQSENQNILVFDLGGGTFDVTIIEVNADAITVICTGGDHELGGKNWDETIASWFAERFSFQTGIATDELTQDPETWQELLIVAEEVKIALSSSLSSTKRIQHGGQKATIELTRDEFNNITAHLVERTLNLTDDLLTIAKTKGCTKIDKFLLVGGSAYMPQIFNPKAGEGPDQVAGMVQTKYQPPLVAEMRQFDPNQAIAKGAALFGFKCHLDDWVNNWLKRWVETQTGQTATTADIAAIPPEVQKEAEQKAIQEHGLIFGLKGLTRKIRNVTSKSFGIVAVNQSDNEVVNNLVIVDDAVPCTQSKKFVTYEDGQVMVLLRCVENTYRDAVIDFPTSVNEQLGAGLQEIGTAELSFLRPLPKDSPVEIVFSLAEDGLLSIRGEDLTTNQKIEGQFKTGAILTVAELEAKKSSNLSMIVN